jgi:hypothetical protein
MLLINKTLLVPYWERSDFPLVFLATQNFGIIARIGQKS